MNVQKDDRKKYDNSMPLVDEGWWESVLAEEQKYTVQRAKHPAHPTDPAPKEAAVEPKTLPVDWESVRHFYRSDGILDVVVSGYNKGGVLVESDGLAGFVPFSHLVDMTGRETSDDRDKSLEAYLGKLLKVKVIECTPENDRIIFSERAALAEPGKRAELFENLERGMRVSGTVTNITDFGVFIDLGGVEGLVHISELSWGRVSHPGQLVNIGENLEVQVMEISMERCRVALSRKRLLPNPWERALEEFPEGCIVIGTITSVLSFGAFANLEVGVEGLIHATEMALQDGQSPRDILSVGQSVQLRVLHVDPEHQRLGFSMKVDAG